MAKNEGYHVTPGGKGWDVKRAGAGRASSSHATKQEAFEAGRKLAKRERTSLRIHKKDGTIQEERSYGNETSRPG